MLLFLYFSKMIPVKKFLWLLPLSFFLTACPFESPVPLDENPLQPADTTLLGYWYGIVKDGSDYFGIEALDISKQSDSVYKIIRYGKSIKGNMIMPDTAHFTGYISRIGDQTYMNVESAIVEVIPRKRKPPEIKTTKIYYIASIELSNDTLTVKTVTDNFYGLNPRFGKPEDLRNVISTLTGKNKNIFDDQYKLSYRKMEKPF